MAAGRKRKIALRTVLLAQLCWVAGTAYAGPGFIDVASVSGNASNSKIEVIFKCNVEYISHDPGGPGDRVRIQLETTGVCQGVSPLIARSREIYRPADADLARLVDIEYDGETSTAPVLTLSFSEKVAYVVEQSTVSDVLNIHVRLKTTTVAGPPPRRAATSTQVSRPQPAAPAYVVNLLSFRRPPGITDVPAIDLAPGQSVSYEEAVVDGKNWYRLRIGTFKSAAVARARLVELKSQFPGAWIDTLKENRQSTELLAAAGGAAPSTVVADGTRDLNVGMAIPDPVPGIGGASIANTLSEEAVAPEPVPNGSDASQVDELMEEARRTMISGDLSRAVQLYTKVLRLPNHARHADAQEYLALAREKNGQMAHASAEYQRYLALYPDGEGAIRVNQRLAALVAIGRPTASAGTSAESGPIRRETEPNPWRLSTFFSQYYRQDVNQLDENEDIVSQSALYSDINFDARRRGERFDFGARVAAGYRSDFLGEEQGAGNDVRVSYAYVDLADAKTGLRGRVGRQSRHTGGVLGRYDGLHFGYQAADSVQLNVVAGSPVNSSSDSPDSTRSFYGASVDYGPVFDGLDLGFFYIQQDIEGINDRQAVGAEFRYFGDNKSLWGMVDFDIAYSELGSAFLQGSWRFPSRLSLHGMIDRRHSPFLSTGNALIGQQVASFSELLVIFTEEELRQLSLDRSAISTTFSAGISYPLTQKLQINADTSQTMIDATIASGGVAAAPATTYSNYSTSIVASSLIRENDVTIIGLRYSDSGTTSVTSLSIDTRFPFGRSFRINPRLRVDHRDIHSDGSEEWIITPGLRMKFRWGRNTRLEFEVGKQYSTRDMANDQVKRESYFINLGYQAFF